MRPNSSSSRSAARFSQALVLAALAAALTACGGGGGDGDSSDPSVWHFRGVNVIADAPNVQFSIDGTAVENADFGAATPYHPARTGSRPLALAIRNPSDLSGTDQGFTDIGTSDSFDFQGPTDYTLVAAGTVADPRKFLITGTHREDVDDNAVEYQVINAAVNAGTLNVFITAPEAGIATPQAVGELAVGEHSDPANLEIAQASGADEDAERSVHITFELRDGNGATVFQSSALSVSEAASQDRLLIVIADNVGPPGGRAVKLFVVANIGAGAAGQLLDPGDDAELRLANLSADTPTMDLITSDQTANVFIANVIPGQASDYLQLEAASYNALVTPTATPGTILFVKDFTASPGGSFSLYGEGNLGSLQGIFLGDDRRSVPTEAHFRFLHASPTESGALDVYVRQSGAGLDLSGTSPPAPSVPDLAHRGRSGTLVLKAGTYDVFVARANATSTLVGPLPLVLTAGDVKTVALVDDGVGGPLELLPIDDARP